MEEQEQSRFRTNVCVPVVKIMVLKLAPNLFDRFLSNFRWRFGHMLLLHDYSIGDLDLWSLLTKHENNNITRTIYSIGLKLGI